MSLVQFIVQAFLKNFFAGHCQSFPRFVPLEHLLEGTDEQRNLKFRSSVRVHVRCVCVSHSLCTELITAFSPDWEFYACANLEGKSDTGAIGNSRLFLVACCTSTFQLAPLHMQLHRTRHAPSAAKFKLKQGLLANQERTLVSGVHFTCTSHPCNCRKVCSRASVERTQANFTLIVFELSLALSLCQSGHLAACYLAFFWFS